MNNTLPYLAGPDDSNCFVFQLKSAPPLKGKAGLLLYSPRLDDAARKSEHERERVLGNGVRVAAGHLADNHGAAKAFACVNMVVACGPRRDELKRWMRVEESRVNPGADVNAENLGVAIDFAYSAEKPQIVPGKRGLEEILFGLLSLGELYLHGEGSSTV